MSISIAKIAKPSGCPTEDTTEQLYPFSHKQLCSYQALWWS